ncbi:hypothetical protein BY996DRAFT_6420940 [Phakopsora pachyrhizi]|nr:hypothetical protein BY996DRAFT_6420940 [Phakopsora pachyrhizi]
MSSINRNNQSTTGSGLNDQVRSNEFDPNRQGFGNVVDTDQAKQHLSDEGSKFRNENQLGGGDGHFQGHGGRAHPGTTGDNIGNVGADEHPKVPFKAKVEGYAKKFAGKTFGKPHEVEAGEARLRGEDQVLEQEGFHK